MSEFTIKPARREAVKPLIGLYGESGCGKTYSALLLARGFVGPAGKILLLDTESGRGSLYADVLPGGYEVMQIDAPFSPGRCVAAMQAAEQSGATIAICDSFSHFWQGIGGVLDMAAQNEESSGKAGLHNWKQPKMEHAKLVLKLLQSKIPWIVCLRAHFKTRQGKDEKGRTAIIKDDLPSPIQAEDFLFELTAHALLFPDHATSLTKCSHPDLRKCFPADKTTPITIEHGQALARWCGGAGVSSPSNPSSGAPATAPGVAALKRRLVAVAIPAFCPHLDDLQQFCWDENLIDPSEKLAQQKPEQLSSIISKLEKRPVDQGIVP